MFHVKLTVLDIRQPRIPEFRTQLLRLPAQAPTNGRIVRKENADPGITARVWRAGARSKEKGAFVTATTLDKGAGTSVAYVTIRWVLTVRVSCW